MSQGLFSATKCAISVRHINWMLQGYMAELFASMQLYEARKYDVT